MATYTSYAQAKIAHPDSEIVTTCKHWNGNKSLIGLFQPLGDGDPGRSHCIGEGMWVTCNPADYCSTLEEFLESGYKLDLGDWVVNTYGNATEIYSRNAMNSRGYNDGKCYILQAAALDGGCKIPSKVKDFCNTDAVKMESEGCTEEWTVYNNTLPLCELTDEQYGKMRRAFDAGGDVQKLNLKGEWVKPLHAFKLKGFAYRIRTKSERELFINKCTDVMRKAGTKCPDNHEYFGVIFDAGARYVDETQHFGEDYK